MFAMSIRRHLLVAVTATLFSAGQAAAQDRPADPFEALNKTSIALQNAAKQYYVDVADPIVIAGGGAILIRQGTNERRVGHIPTAYHLLKAIGHAPRGIWAALRPAIDGRDAADAWRRQLTELRPTVAAVLAALPSADLSEAAKRRDGVMLKTCLDMIDYVLANGLPTEARLQAAMRDMTPTLLADATEAARLHLDSIDRDVRPWWNALTQQQRDRTYVVVHGARPARVDNLAYAYFLNLLGPTEDGRRLIFAEGIFTDTDAKAILAAALTDRRLAEDFFRDETRMDRDLLGDGAEARLLELFGRLGRP